MRLRGGHVLGNRDKDKQKLHAHMQSFGTLCFILMTGSMARAEGA